MVIKWSAPSGATGHVNVRLGATSCGTKALAKSTYFNDPGQALDSFNVTGTGTSNIHERITVLNAPGAPSPPSLDNYSTYSSLTIYLQFTNCTQPLQIHGIWFFYDPTLDGTVLDNMETLADCYPDVFHGVHMLMGWSQPMSASPTSANYVAKYIDPFFKRWLVEGQLTSLSYLSVPSVGTKPPALAVAVGPSGNEMKYLYETWSGAEGTAAPKGACYLVWAMPFFTGAPDGYYFIE